MEHLSRRFSFTCDALPGDTFGVIDFRGSEEVSQCYQFDITLASKNLEIDFKKVVQHTATFTLYQKDGSAVDYHGLILRFEQFHEVDGVAYYRAALTPRLYFLSFTRHNQVFLGRTVEEFITECLKDGGLTELNFEFRLRGEYEPLDYVCQYGESHLDFISRWLEFEGIYYYFEQTTEGEKVIFTDTHAAHGPIAKRSAVRYSPPSGLEEARMEEIVRGFSCGFTHTPAGVTLKDYDYMKPSLDVAGNASVDELGRGRFYSFGEHIRSPEEGQRIANIRAESLLCRRQVFQGEGSVCGMSPGFTFDLQDHYRRDFNQTYLITKVDHEGGHTEPLGDGLTGPEDKGKEDAYYRNRFAAIVSSVQFRPERKTGKPRVSGIIPAKIDAAGSGHYAEIDEHGRYKVILPFDISGRKEGKASVWIRMATPYAGSNHGMHFPLHKGTEVLIACVDGDADRPVILAAVPNPETPSPVTTDNETTSMILTAGGNRITMDDKAGSENIFLSSPNHESSITIGASGDDSKSEKGWQGTPGSFGLTYKTEKGLLVEAAMENSVIMGESTSTIVGGCAQVVAGLTVYGYGGGFVQATAGLAVETAEATIGYSTTDQQIRGVSDKVTEAENAIVGSTLMINDVNTRISNVKTELGQQHTQAMDDIVQTYVAKNDLGTTVTQAIGTATRALANSVNTLGQRVDMITDDLGVMAQVTQTIGNQLKSVANVTKTIATETKCVTEANTLAGLISMM